MMNVGTVSMEMVMMHVWPVVDPRLMVNARVMMVIRVWLRLGVAVRVI